MRHFQYKPAKFHFTDHQVKKILNGQSVRLQHHQIGTGSHILLLHPVQHHKISKAHAKNSGSDLHVSNGELHATIHSGIAGTGFWDVLKDGASWLWNNVAKPVLGVAGDAGASELKNIASSVPIVGQLAGPLIDKGREALKSTTGIGLHHKKGKKMHHPHKHLHEHEHEHHMIHHNAKTPKKRIHKHGNGLYL